MPLMIIVARILDVSIGTLRIIYLAQRRKIIVPILGFVEILIWLIVIGQVMQNLTNPVYYIAYAVGFAIGNYIGISLEEMLAMGNLMVRVVTRTDDTRLITSLRNHNYKVTVVDAEGQMGPVKILFTIIRRKDKDDVLKYVKEFNPRSFYTIEEVQKAQEDGVSRNSLRSKQRYYRWTFFRHRKGK